MENIGDFMARKKRTKIKIDYSKCGESGNIDPRDCGKCLQVCDPCVFLRHMTLKSKPKDPFDPQDWRITAVWPSVCTRCLQCIDICPENAISIKW